MGVWNQEEVGLEPLFYYAHCRKLTSLANSLKFNFLIS